MKIDLNEIEALARAATPGPWKWDGRTVDANDGYVHIPECSYIVGLISLAGHYEGYQEDCDFIAAANPAAVLELITLARGAVTSHANETPHALTKAASKAVMALSHCQLEHGDNAMYQEIREELSMLLRVQPVQQPAPAWTGEAVYAIYRGATDKPHKQDAWTELEPHRVRQFGRMADALNVTAAPVAAPVAGQGLLLVQALKDIAEACNCCGDRHDLAQIAQDALDASIGHYELSKTTQFKVMNHRLAEIFSAPVPAASVPPFQQRVQPWMMACFGAEISADKDERNHRFFEESTELVQAGGMTASEAHQLVDYVYGRPVGEPAQKVGGVMVTLAALCLANGIDMDAAAETELARIWTKVEAIRAKQAAKPKHSPLPAPPNAEASIEAALAAFCDQEGYPSDGPMDGVLRKAFAAGASFAFDWKGGA